MAQSFTASVGDWVLKSDALLLGVVRESAKRVTAAAQKTRSEGGNMRVKTGFLRASGTPVLNNAALGTSENPGNFVEIGDDPTVGPVNLVLAEMKLGDVYNFIYTANYAPYREYYDGFVRLAAQQWPAIVAEVATELRSRAGG